MDKIEVLHDAIDELTESIAAYDSVPRPVTDGEYIAAIARVLRAGRKVIAARDHADADASGLTMLKKQAM